MPVLRVKAGPQTGQVFEIGRDSVVIGRDCPGGIQILDQGASRRHAELFHIGDMLFIRDLKSRNGTHVNEEPIAEELLQLGDRIRIGATVFVLAGGTGDGATPAAAASKSEEVEVVEFEHQPHEKAFAQTIVLDLDKSAGDVMAGEVGGRDMRNLNLIYQISQTISGEKSVGALLGDVLKVAAKALEADGAYVFVRDAASGNFMPRASWHRDKGTSVAVSTSIIKRVIDIGKAILTTDASEDQRFAAKQSVVMKKIRSVVCAPLKSRARVHGVLYLHQSRADMTFETEDLELVTAISLMTATAMESMVATARQRANLFNVIRGLIALLEEKDPDLKGHSLRVMNYASAVGQTLGLSPRERYALELAALLHDIGKLGMTDDATDRRVRQEEIVKAGERFVRSMKSLDLVLPGIRYQYARLDGTGYPAEVLPEEIPVMGRVIAVCKDFDIQTTIGGINHQGLPVSEAIVDLAQHAGTRYDETVVQALLKAHKNGRLYNPQPVFKDFAQDESG